MIKVVLETDWVDTPGAHVGHVFYNHRLAFGVRYMYRRAETIRGRGSNARSAQVLCKRWLLEEGLQVVRTGVRCETLH